MAEDLHETENKQAEENFNLSGSFRLNKQAEESFDLFGSFRFKVDAKGRVALPSKFRKALSKDLIVSKAPLGECIYVFEPDSFNHFVKDLFDAKFGGYNPSKREHLNLLRKLKANADLVEVDSSGRISLKQDIRKGAGIKKDVVLVGSTGRLEIWDADTFDATMEDVDLSVFFD